MYKIIGGDQKEYGPVTVDQVRQWIVEGRATGSTLVQSEGSEEWLPLSNLPEFSAALAVQRSYAPASGDGTNDPDTLARQLLAGGATFSIGDCLRCGGAILVENLGLALGATALVWLASTACYFIPVCGGVIGMLLKGILFGGLSLVFLKMIRHQPTSVGEAFSGFQIIPVPLMLGGIVVDVLCGIGFLFCVLPYVYLKVAWCFALPLIIDRKLGFWPAMELSRRLVTRHWFKVFALLCIAYSPVLLCQGFIFFSLLPKFMAVFMTGGPPDMPAILEVMRTAGTYGSIYLVVLLVNLPFATGALMCAYETLFHPRTTTTA